MSSQKGFAEKKELGKGSSYRNMHHVAFWVWWNTSSFATTSSFFLSSYIETLHYTVLYLYNLTCFFGSGNGGGLGFESHSLSFSGIPKTIQTHQPGTILTDWMVVIRCDLGGWPCLCPYQSETLSLATLIGRAWRCSAKAWWPFWNPPGGPRIQWIKRGEMGRFKWPKITG